VSKKSEFIKGLLLLAAILLVILLMLFSGSPETIQEKAICQQIYDEIEADLKKSNYCSADSDCDAIQLGGMSRCYSYINKNVDKRELYSKISSYSSKRCSQLFIRCMSAPPALCENKQCVSKKSR
jgi:outer membrane protein assembly factor BamD (BamD/ComL family)